MTWIVDLSENGDGVRRWVDSPPRKERRHPRALRFAEVKVGDHLEQKSHHTRPRDFPFFIVTDRWFDPVAGQKDRTAGEMVGLQRIGRDGNVVGSKFSTTLRGLASQQYVYAERDLIEFGRARAAALADGSVVGIGRGRVIRQRPKLPGL